MSEIISSHAENELLKSVQEVGEVLLSLWPGKTGRGTETLEVTSKPDGSLVTRADKLASQKLVETLTALFPGDGILSEELPISPELQRKNRVWIIDPLDGTHSFVTGRDDFSILVGLCIGSEAAFGVMYFPCSGLMAVGKSGQSATANGEQLNVSASPVARKESIYVRNLGARKDPVFYPHKMDSGMALLRLADGTFDGVILNMTTHGEWDLVAPTVVLKSAGALVTDELGNSLQFSKTGKLNAKSVVASNRLVHADLLRYVS